MKKFLTKTFSSKPITVCGVLFILIAPTRWANADPLKEARVSQVIQDVRLLEAHAAPHPAAVNDKVILGSAVRTGGESRAELTFNDLTITRLGANSGRVDPRRDSSPGSARSAGSQGQHNSGHRCRYGRDGASFNGSAHKIYGSRRDWHDLSARPP